MTPTPCVWASDLDNTPSLTATTCCWRSWRSSSGARGAALACEKIPREKALVERMKGRPFAMLGVNTDADAAAARKVMEEKGVTWPNWHDGSPGSGPIAKLYHVQGYPTIYVLDAAGKIRSKKVLGRFARSARREAGGRTGSRQQVKAGARTSAVSRPARVDQVEVTVGMPLDSRMLAGNTGVFKPKPDLGSRVSADLYPAVTNRDALPSACCPC